MLMRLFFLVVFLPQALYAGSIFDSLFFPKTLRMDYYHTGNSAVEFYSFDELSEEPFWGGSHTQLTDPTLYGQYWLNLKDAQSGQIIYSRGYTTLFSEWQTTDEAKNIQKTFGESVVMPYPRKNAVIELLSRNRNGVFEKKFEYMFLISDPNINRKSGNDFPVYEAYLSGASASCLDIVILPEGYTQNEMDRFRKDCEVFARELISYSPYSEYKDKINIRGVLAPSAESGTDQPAKNIWKNTLLNSRFSTFGLDRYCMTHDFKTIRNIASNAPYDQIYILVNSSEYGGGSIFNHYSLSVNSNASAGKIFIHELGHGFAGLADEYFNTEIAYNDFYNLSVEPWEANITTLVDFETKWKSLREVLTPVPTPPTEEFTGTTGVFEGGGYAAKGIYRPAYDCLMNTFRSNTFCPVCQQTIRKMLELYTQ